MSATLMPFIPSSRPSRPLPTRQGPQLLSFLTRQEFARRECARLYKAYEQWLLRKWALSPGAPIEDSPLDDIATCAVIERSLRWRRRPLHTFDTVQRPTPPHPLWRVVCWCGRGVDRFLSGLHTALLVYFTALGLTAFPLFAHARWLGALAMATAGSVFGWLLFERFRLTARPRVKQLEAR